MGWGLDAGWGRGGAASRWRDGRGATTAAARARAGRGSSGWGAERVGRAPTRDGRLRLGRRRAGVAGCTRVGGRRAFSALNIIVTIPVIPIDCGHRGGG